jgi:hypothetical protein
VPVEEHDIRSGLAHGGQGFVAVIDDADGEAGTLQASRATN